MFFVGRAREKRNSKTFRKRHSGAFRKLRKGKLKMKLRKHKSKKQNLKRVEKNETSSIK